MNDHAQRCVARAEALLDVNRAEAALPLLYEAASLDPNSSQVHCLLARALLDLHRHREVLTAAERAAALAPFDEWPHRLRTWALLGLRRHEEAMEAAEEAVRLAPHLPETLAALTEACLAEGDVTRARQAAQEAVRVAPGNVLGHHAVARWALETRRFHQAEAACRRILAIDPTDETAMNNLGVVHFRHFRWVAALRNYSAAVQLDPTDELPQQNLRRGLIVSFAVVGFLLLTAIVNIGGWLRAFRDLDLVGQLTAGLGVTVAVAALVHFGPGLARTLLPPPAAAAALDLLLFRGLRRRGPLSPQQLRSTRIRFSVSAFFAVGGFMALFDPEEELGPALGTMLIALAVLIMTARQLLSHHRWQRSGASGA